MFCLNSDLYRTKSTANGRWTFSHINVLCIFKEILSVFVNSSQSLQTPNQKLSVNDNIFSGFEKLLQMAGTTCLIKNMFWFSLCCTNFVNFEKKVINMHFKQIPPMNANLYKFYSAIL